MSKRPHAGDRVGITNWMLRTTGGATWIACADERESSDDIESVCERCRSRAVFVAILTPAHTRKACKICWALILMTEYPQRDPANLPTVAVPRFYVSDVARRRGWSYDTTVERMRTVGDYMFLVDVVVDATSGSGEEDDDDDDE